MVHHTKDKGDIGMGQVISSLLSADIQVALPISEHLPFDLIAISKSGALSKLQVKYRTKIKGKLRVLLSSSWSDKNGVHSKPHSESGYDALAIYCPETNQVYYVNNRYIKGTALILRIDRSKNNQTKGVLMADQFINPTLELFN